MESVRAFLLKLPTRCSLGCVAYTFKLSLYEVYFFDGGARLNFKAELPHNPLLYYSCSSSLREYNGKNNTTNVGLYAFSLARQTTLYIDQTRQSLFAPPCLVTNYYYFLLKEKRKGLFVSHILYFISTLLFFLFRRKVVAPEII